MQATSALLNEANLLVYFAVQTYRYSMRPDGDVCTVPTAQNQYRIREKQTTCSLTESLLKT